MIKRQIIFSIIFSLSLLLFTETCKAENRVVVMETTLGEIEIELFEKAAPIAVENFLDYVNDHFYDGLIFHRVIKNFVVQGGGLYPDLTEKPTRAPIINEAKGGKANRRGTVAMARTSEIHSATSQFFFNLRDNFSLDHKGEADKHYGYTVFGRVIKGMDVVNKIAQIPTTKKNGMPDVPSEEVAILSTHLK